MNKKITKVEVQKNNKERVNIYIDGEFELSCSAELAYKYNLKSGKVIEPEEFGGLVSEDNYIKCKTAALRYMERSYKSQKEITDKLLEKGYEEETVHRVLEFLKSYGFVDDKNYVQLYAKEKLSTQGKNKIKHALSRKGIHEEVIEECLRSFDSSIEENTALAMAEKKLKTLVKSEKDRRKIYRKLGEFLIRNGFSVEKVKDVVERVMRDYLWESEDAECDDANMSNKSSWRNSSLSNCSNIRNISSDSKRRNYGNNYNMGNADNSSCNNNDSSLEDDSSYNDRHESVEQVVDLDRLFEMAKKRYDIIIKSETNKSKLYKKLCDYLMRRGYSYEDIKRVLYEIID